MTIGYLLRMANSYAQANLSSQTSDTGLILERVARQAILDFVTYVAEHQEKKKK